MRLVAVFVVPTILILAGWLIWGESLDRIMTVEALQSTGSWAWAAGLGLFIADFFLPVPGTIILSGLGLIYGLVMGGILGSLGLVLTGLLGYGIGRLCGERFARKWLGDDFERGERIFKKGGGWMVALSRALPMIPEMICCTAGLLRMPFGKFFTSLVCGSVPMAFLFSWVGSIGEQAPGWMIALSLVVPGILWLAAMGLKNIRS